MQGKAQNLFLASRSLILFERGHREAFENVFPLVTHIYCGFTHMSLRKALSSSGHINGLLSTAKLSPFLVLLQETRPVLPHKSALRVKRRLTIYEADNVSSGTVTEKSEQAPPPEELRSSFAAITGTC